MQGVLIGSVRSGSGKTTLSLGLMRAFARRGLGVAPLKCGPDYIDPAFHAAAARRIGCNLDSWAMTPDLIAALAAEVTTGADVVLAEGLMGLFDGVGSAPGRTGSSADIAAALGLPVLLVHDVSGQSTSAAAVVLGVKTFDPRLTLGGVVLNRVGSERHRKLVTTAIEDLGVAVFGALPRQDSVALPERHLGLVQAGETAELDARLDAMADFVSAHVDLDRLHAAMAPMLPPKPSLAHGPAVAPPGQRIALASDAAFSFLYPHVVAGWRAAGAEILPFSPLADEGPDASANCCWLPGGYPELHAGQLAAADRFLGTLRRFAQTRPVHGECGGYMVLGQGLEDAGGTRHAMAGLLGVETSYARRKLHLGYRQARLAADTSFGRQGDLFTGHEFHYATTLTRGSDEPFAEASDAHGSSPVADGSRRGQVSGSFFHLIAQAES